MAFAFGLAALFFIWTQAYFTPMHVGVDQNGYLVGGKQISLTLLPRQQPRQLDDATKPDPHAFVADMWVQAANDKTAFDPKYPVGLPLVYAVLIWLTAGGTTAAYYVSPVAMALSLPATFVVARRFAGTYGAVLATIALAVSPLVAYVVNNPNSHAVCVCAATWGMAAVLRWWHGGARRWAVVGGLLVGYAATVRYTEGLLVLPLMWAAVVPVVRRPWRQRVVDAVALGVAWAVPVALLAGYNLYFLGTLTGYDATHESTGFAWSYFFDNWETFLRQMNANGLLFLLPLAVAGLLWLPFRDWKRGGLLALWAVPISVLYLFYYWGPDGVSYLRFFVTVTPPLLIAAVSLLRVRPTETPGVTAADERRRLLGLFAQGVAAMIMAAGLGYFVFHSVRYDAAKDVTLTLQQYVDKAPTAYQRFGIAASLVCGTAAAALTAGAIVMSRRKSVPALAGGVVTLLSCAVAADASTAWLEQQNYVNNAWLASVRAAKETVPDGAVFICRETDFLHAMQFVSDDRCYTGLTFDRNWVNGRPQAAAADPVLVDPVRGQQLVKALEGKDQNALNNEARATIKAGLAARRRVFVVEQTQPDPMRQAVREKKEGPVPDFIRRYVNRPKDTSLVGRRVDWWQVPTVIRDEFPNVPRGRRTSRPDVRPRLYQVWEIEAGPPTPAKPKK